MNIKAEDIADLFDEFYLIRETKTPTVLETPISENINAEPTNNLQPNEDVVELNQQTNPIVSPQKLEETKKAQPVPQLFYSGANKKHITFIYNDKIIDTKDNVDLIINVLTKVLKISLEDIAMIRLSKNNTHSLQQITGELQPKKVLLWGCQELLQQQNISYDLHTIKNVSNINLLMADMVHQYHGNDSYKKDLLNALLNWSKL